MQRSALRPLTVALLAAASHGQSVCFEGAVSVPTCAQPLGMVLTDLDGDGDQDAVVVCPASTTLAIHTQDGNGGFAAAQNYALLGITSDLVATDFDGDGDMDVIARAGSLRAFVNTGGGALVLQTIYTPSTNGQIVAGDIDGDGDTDLVTVVVGTSSNALSVLLRGPSGEYTTQSILLWSNGRTALALGDLDGDGDLDLVAQDVDFDTTHVYRNNGAGLFSSISVTPSDFNTVDLLLADLDGDLDLDLVTVGGFGATVSLHRNSGSGVFAAPVQYPLTGYSGTLASGDFDGDGDIDLAADTSAPAVGGGYAFRFEILENLGSFTFVAGPSSLVGGIGLAAADLDGDGDADLASIANTSGALLSIRSCTRSGVPVCAGDGSATACPCGNASAPGSGAGCRNSFGLDGRLRGTGAARVATDGLVLTLDGTPTMASALFFQGTLAESGGAGVVFGDGLRCASGTVVRIATKVCSGGVAAFPAPGDASISAVGSVIPGTERIYQVWYRNSANFCTPAGFNLSNGLRVAWGV